MTAIDLGVISVRMYGVMIALGMLAGVWVARAVARKAVARGEGWKGLEDEVWDVLFWGFGFGLVGARAYHVVDYWEVYAGDVMSMIAVWQGGLGIYGGLFGGVVGILAYAKSKVKSQKSKAQVKRVNSEEIGLWGRVRVYLDLAAVGMPVAQAIGRWGNYFNQELYGLPTNLPWGINISLEHRAESIELYDRFHPLFAYEAGLNLILAGLLWKLIKRWELGSGRLVMVYLAGYAIIRFGLEFLRIDPWRWGVLTVAQWISVGVVFIVGVWLWKVERRVVRVER